MDPYREILYPAVSVYGKIRSTLFHLNGLICTRIKPIYILFERKGEIPNTKVNAIQGQKLIDFILKTVTL